MLVRCVFVFLCFFNLSYTQDISGLWVHDVDGTNPTGFDAIYAIMYLRMDESGKVIGYTYDYHAGGTCNFYLEGEYDIEKNRLIAANTKKINKAFFHARSRFKLFYEEIGDEAFLVGKARQKGVHGLVFSFGGLFSIPLSYRKIKSEDFEAIKGYDVLKPYIDALEIDLKEEKEAGPTLEERPITEVTQPDEDIEFKEHTILEVEETLTELVETNDKKKEIEAFTKSKDNRKNELIISHNVTSRKIILEIFDNSRQDEDRISIYVNDSLVTYNLEVTKDPKMIALSLSEDKNTHQVLFVANNMGSVPPNTATIKYTVDGITYEEELFTNLRLSKYLEFIID
ncbi:hypothetical protein [Winogradskyella sp.]|uniref:hypothetical protein n=1 Tax=Winogradskyella sp. TaxID=1883156 RepID=UPI002631BAF8|nr:hypothetical protein [Winogradskyella sp.]